MDFQQSVCAMTKSLLRGEAFERFNTIVINDNQFISRTCFWILVYLVLLHRKVIFLAKFFFNNEL